jgi:uncharacterized protein
MPYFTFDPLCRDSSLAGSCALTVMAKAPRAGRVKTRLAPPLTSEQAAQLNISFLKDTTENLAAVAAAGSARGVISYTPVGEESLFDDILPASFSLVAQRGDGFGERLFFTAEDVLTCGFSAVCLIDSDSPTVPTEVFSRAVTALAQPGDRVVLGPSQDGGYYLIGLKQAHRAVFEGIHWSTAAVYQETVEAVHKAALELVELPLWYDVDDPKSLQVLKNELLDDVRPSFVSAEGYAAPHSMLSLEQMYAVTEKS